MRNKIHPINKSIGKMIKDKRKSLGMTQTQLASFIGVSYQQMQRYENGSNRVSVETLHSIAPVLSCTITQILEAAVLLHEREGM